MESATTRHGMRAADFPAVVAHNLVDRLLQFIGRPDAELTRLLGAIGSELGPLRFFRLAIVQIPAQGFADQRGCDLAFCAFRGALGRMSLVT